MKSNASILTFLSISLKDREQIVFAFCKEVEDEAPSGIYWYPQKGKDGISEFIWKEKRLKQWLLVGHDVEIQNKWKELLTLSEFSFFWSTNSVKFLMPNVNKVVVEEDFVKINGIDVCNRKEYPVEYQCVSFPFDISFLLVEENNCSFIEGYKLHDKIKPVIPYGLFTEKSLSKYLERKTCAVFEKRGIYWSLRGDRNSIVEGEPSRYIGFVQAAEQFRRDHGICIRDIKGTKVLGKGEISVDTGKWELDLSEPTGKGQFLIQEKQTGDFLCGEKFYLIKEININTEVIHTVLTDLYGRKINLSKKETLPISDTPIIWDLNSAPDITQSEIELSDKITNTLLTLGKTLVFIDPFFFGDINENDNNMLTSKSQKIFLNGLITAIARGKIEEIIIIGYWQKARKFIKGDRSKLEQKYQLLYKLIKYTFNNTQVLNIKKFELVLSKEPMHDRYWIGDDIMYSVSNSINGIFESRELRIIKEDYLSRIKLQARFERRYKNGDRISLIPVV